ncbi:MAG: family 78 glycoside hydrolase catalytic domain, partial [Eubacteriales bacterium]
MFEIKDLTIDYVPSPTAAPVRGLRFGWKPDADGEGVLQESYRITVSDRDGHLFDSGVVRCDRVENIEPGFVLQTRTDYRVRVSVRNNRGETAEGESCFSTEIGRDEWTAKWIRPKKFIDGWSPFLRKKFEVSQPVVSAKLYACGLGCGEFYLNGEKVGDALIDPPATNYDKRVLYRAYDVTDRIRDKNALAIWLGEGWYAQSRVWEGGLRYGRECAILQLELTLRDGSKQTVCTDEGWLSKYSPISLNNLYGGECYDGRLETPDFALYDCDESEFGPVVLDETPKGELCPCNIPPVRVIRRIPAQEVWGLSGVSDGAWVVDMGENFAGVAEFHIPPSPRGAVYVFRYSEAVAPDGHPDYRSSGSFATQCVQQDIYIARGDKDGEVWTPRFCYHGFRYIEVTGHHDYKAYSVMPGKDFCVGLALSTDLRPSGDFRCGYPPMNDLRDIALRTFLSNYHGYPEDCPAREKCGWLGDAQLVADWALYEFDLCACYEKYIRDILDTKEVYGELQMISPGKRGCGEATPLWGCAQVMLPYDLLLYCGNSRIIRESFPSIESWVAHEIGRSDDLIIKDGLGDWCPPVGHQSERRIPVAQSSTLQLYEICEKTAVLCRLTGLG